VLRTDWYGLLPFLRLGSLTAFSRAAAPSVLPATLANSPDRKRIDQFLTAPHLATQCAAADGFVMLLGRVTTRLSSVLPFLPFSGVG
jgi:hypothetical protein